MNYYVFGINSVVKKKFRDRVNLAKKPQPFLAFFLLKYVTKSHIKFFKIYLFIHFTVWF